MLLPILGKKMPALARDKERLRSTLRTLFRYGWILWLNCAATTFASAAFVDHAEAQSRAVPAAAAICQPCHGLDGVGHDVEIPNIAGQHSVYLRNQLLAFKRGQRRHPEMRYVAHELTERDIDELVQYYSTLRSP